MRALPLLFLLCLSCKQTDCCFFGSKDGHCCPEEGCSDNKNQESPAPTTGLAAPSALEPSGDDRLQPDGLSAETDEVLLDDSGAGGEDAAAP